MYIKANHLDKVSYAIRGKIAQKSYELRLQGINILELNIGNPGLFDFKVPTTMKKALIHNLDQAGAYCDSKGLFTAREAVLMDAEKYDIHLDIENIFLGNGASELILMSLEALLNDGDEVLVPSPDYPLWSSAVVIAGGNAVHYNCDSDNSWFPKIADMEQKITAKTKAIVVINPNNPTGAVYPKELLQEILKLAKKHNLIVFSDEIYSKVLYDNAEFTPMASLANDVLIGTFNGLSKNYRACGYRAGWFYLSGPVTKAKSYIEGLSLLSSMRLCANVMGQLCIPIALGGLQSITTLCSTGRLKQQRDYVIERVSKINDLSLVSPKGALYAFIELDLSKYNFVDDQDFVLKFLNEKHVLLVHGSGFNYDRSIAFRLAFLPRVDMLSEAFDRLENFLEKHRI